MSDHEHHHHQPANHHNCGNLFGCGEENGTGILRSDIQEAASSKRSMDRLLHMDEMNQERLDGYLSARGRSRRTLLRASGFMGALAAIGPWFQIWRLVIWRSVIPPLLSKRTPRTTAPSQPPMKATCTWLSQTSRPSIWAFLIPRCRPLLRLNPAIPSAIPIRGRTS